MSEPAERLDSWKAIAEYLNRDVRTLRRWERQGLPVHRVAGAPGNSVFAYRTEIDAWLKQSAEARAVSPSAVTVTPSLTPPTPPMRAVEPSAETVKRTGAARWRLIAAVLVVLIGTAIWRVRAPSAAEQRLSITMSPTSVLASDASGRERWRFDLPSDVLTYPSEMGAQSLVTTGESAAVLVQSSHALRRSDSAPLSGELRWLSPEGRLVRSFSFDDVWSFGAKMYSAPWAMTDFRVNDSGGQRRIALASHHWEWWPSVVTVLDGNWQRVGTFVNSGWVESLRWLTPERLAISGFSESRDGGMVALLDARHVDGTSPEDGNSRFACGTCRPGEPLQYFVFPRSELNRVTGSAFNRAILSASDDRILARTQELDRPTLASPVIDAVYEFSPSLEFLGASYSDRYWDRHQALEREGKITHTREQCPERNGPPIIYTWTSATGWQTVRTLGATQR